MRISESTDKSFSGICHYPSPVSRSEIPVCSFVVYPGLRGITSPLFSLFSERGVGIRHSEHSWQSVQKQENMDYNHIQGTLRLD